MRSARNKIVTDKCNKDCLPNLHIPPCIWFDPKIDSSITPNPTANLGTQRWEGEPIDEFSHELTTQIQRYSIQTLSRKIVKDMFDEVKYTRKLKLDVQETLLYKMGGEQIGKSLDFAHQLYTNTKQLKSTYEDSKLYKDKYSSSTIAYFITITTTKEKSSGILPYLNHLLGQKAFVEGTYKACFEWQQPEIPTGGHIHIMLYRDHKRQHRDVKKCIHQSYSKAFDIPIKQITDIQIKWSYINTEDGVDKVIDYIEGNKTQDRMDKVQQCYKLREKLGIPHIYESN